MAVEHWIVVEGPCIKEVEVFPERVHMTAANSECQTM